MGSREDVVMLRDQMVRVARFYGEFFTAMAGIRQELRTRALICELIKEGRKRDFNFAL